MVKGSRRRSAFGRGLMPLVSSLLGWSAIGDAQTITEFPVPTAESGPQGIAAGPDGALWFTEMEGGNVGRITTAGTITEFSRLKPQIQVSGDRATARWDLLCPCRLMDGSSYWMCGYEDDTYIRIGDTWLQQSMKLTTLFMSSVAKGWTRILA